jgi:ribose-phosphate pyrophosphokinase
MGMTLNIWLDNQAIVVETGCFPDGAVWAKARTELPGFANKMVVRATGLATMDD